MPASPAPPPADSKLDALAAGWPALDALLDQALDLPAEERDAWVDSLAGEAAPLRDTLRRLLAGQARFETGDFLGELPRLPGLAAACAEDNPHQPAPGLAVGPYRLIRELGRGGMGAVWLAERADGQLRRTVALKLPGVAWGRDLAERLAREREILASLEHPHIARLYDVGVDARGRPYFAMEYVEGRPIDAYGAEHALGPRERLALVLQVCAAVAHAHSRLVIHRDLKPGNILVTGDGQVRLLDFGIAKALEGDRAEETELTRLSGRALTLDYASPEQIRGEALGTGSDVYSLAVVTYELLTGAKPYRLKRGSAAELEEAIASADPPRASDAAPSPALKKRLRGDLDAILAKALKKDPAERYPTVVAFADDLARHLDGHAVQARPESRLYLARKFLRRHRVPAAALGATLVALSAGLGVALWQSHAATEQARRAEQAVDREGAVKMMYMDTLSIAAGWDRAEFEKPGAFGRLLLARLDDFETRFKDRPEQRLGLLEAVAVQLPFFGDYEGSLVVGRRYLALLTQMKSDPWRILRAHLGNARALDNLGRPEEAEEVLRQALDTVPEDADSLNNRVAVMSELGKVHIKLGKRAAARRVLAAAAPHLGRFDDGSIRWDARVTLARLDVGYDDPAALRAMRAAHDEYMAYAHAQPSEIGYSHLLMGMTLANMGRPAEAEPFAREALRRFRDNYGGTDRDTVLALGRLAATIGAQGRHDEARTLLAETRAEVSARPGPDTAGALATLAGRQLENELAWGDLDAAGRFAALVDAPTLALPAAGDRIVFVTAQAEWLRRAGRAEEAARHVEQWLLAQPTAARETPDGFKATPGLARIDALLATMRREAATGTWLFRETTEVAALARAEQGRVAEALAMLDGLERAPGAAAASAASASVVPPAFQPAPAPSIAHRADSALRRARVLLLAGRHAEAAAAARSLDGDLAGQHPASDRLEAARRLRQAAGS